MKSPRLQLDEKCRTVTVDGHTTELQEKAWQVLSILREHAPATVTRAQIIDIVWQGNVLTGEKGLNQSIWSIRNALDEEPRQPVFIRTLPRVGYQWIYTTPQRAGIRSANTTRKVAGVFAISMLATFMAQSSTMPYDKHLSESEHAVATRAYLVNRDVHVELDDGCVAILKNANNKDIGFPVLSADGAEVAVALHEPEGCRLLTIEVMTGERRDFGSCPII